MRKLILQLFMAVILFSVVSCDYEDETIRRFDGLNFMPSSTRISGGNYQNQEPQMFLTYNEFNQYLDDNFPYYSELLRRTEDFFENYFIVTFVTIGEIGASNPIIDVVDYNGNIEMMRVISENGMSDMAQWLVEIALSNEYIPEKFTLNMTTVQR